MSDRKTDLRKSLKSLYDDLLDAEKGKDKEPFGFKHRLEVIHENLEEMIPRLLAEFPHLGEFSAFGDFVQEYYRRGESGMDQLLKSEIKKLAIEIGADLEQDYTTKETTLTKTSKKENDDNSIETVPKHHWTRGEKIVVSGLGVAAIIITILVSPIGMNFFFPPEPEINVTDLNAQDGIVEGNKFVYSYEPRSLTQNGTKNEIFSLKVSNTGNANAHDFWIIIDSKPDGLWFDFQSSVIIHEGNPTPCQQKSSYCTIGLVPKESSNMIVEYNVEFDHKLYQEIVDETPKLFFNYGFDEGEEQTIEVLLKFD